MTSPARVPARASNPLPRIALKLSEQLRAMVPVFVYGGLLLLLTVGLVWLPMSKDIAADPDPIIRALLATQMFRVEIWLAALLVLCGSVAAVAALWRARRFAQSRQRIREALGKLAVADLQPLSLPAGDPFHDLEAPYAGVVNRIEALKRDRVELLHLLRHNLEGLAQRARQPQTSAAELRESIEVMRREIDDEIKKLQMKS